jgi:ABC-type phosphate transport system substrate-binding protein
MAPPTRRAAFLALLAVVSARPAQLAAPHFAQRDGHDVAVAAKVSTKCAFRNADGSISRVASAEDVCACGSNLPNKLYQLASRAYDEYSGNVGGHFDYAATGSNVGKESIVGALVDLAGTDSLLKDADYAAAPDLQMYPASASAVAPVFNLPS